MSRLLCCRSSDSDGRDLRFALSSLDRYNMSGSITRLPRMDFNGARREMPVGRGWIGLKAETHGGPGRLGAGLQAKICCWRLGHCTVPTDDVNGTIPG